MQYERKTIDFRSIKEMPREDRPRERLHRLGPKGVSDIELVCAMLGSGSHGRPVQDLAEDILHLIDSGKVSPEDLQEVQGLGPAKVASICAGLELGRRMSSTRLRSCKDPASVFDLVRHYGDRVQEHFLVVMLNGAHELMGVNLVTIGLVNRTLVHPREVFSDPIRMRATAIILAHNHPSGNLEPSPDDLEVTLRLKKAGLLLGIEVLDHIIFSSEDYRSMSETGEML
ncbi:MAG: DNA repair protein RadC [Sphaerochaetaceae bacterium]|nr:DNA repair protein RadC [Sphaerochaetaceae bacterium]